MAYNNDNSGALFKNDRKEKETHPDYKGKINIEGVEYWQSAWLKEGAKGKYFSQSFTKIEPKEEPKSVEKQIDEDLDKDLPF